MRHTIIIIILLFFVATLHADTINMKNGDRIKGLVVDEYADRVIMNTVDGEEDIFRKDIEDIEYDTPEQTFMQLGRSYEAKGWYDKASFYYKKAMEINPDYKEARELYLASYTKSWRQKDEITKKEIKWRNMVMDWWKDKDKKTPPPKKDYSLLLKKTLGFSLSEKKGYFTIDTIRPYSAAAKGGIKGGDVLVGIWGRLIRYSKMEEVVDELLGPKHSELKVLVEKEIVIPTEQKTNNLYKELGILLGFEYEGLLIKNVTPGEAGERLGFKEGDSLIKIDKNVTRYIPFDGIIAIINNADNKDMVFTIRRNVTLRRGGA